MAHFAARARDFQTRITNHVWKEKRLTNRWRQRLCARQYRAPLSRRLRLQASRQLSLGYPLGAACLSSGVRRLGFVRESGPVVRRWSLGRRSLGLAVSIAPERDRALRSREQDRFGFADMLVLWLSRGDERAPLGARRCKKTMPPNQRLQPTPMNPSVSSFAVTRAALAPLVPALARLPAGCGVSEPRR